MMVLGRTKLRQVGLIDRYLARSIAVPLIGSLILAAMLLLLDKMLRLFQFVVDSGGPVSVVWRKSRRRLLPNSRKLPCNRRC